MTPLWGAGQEIETKIDSLTVDVSALGTTTRLGNIKGVDRGTISGTVNTTSKTATIGAVVLSRSQLQHLGGMAHADAIPGSPSHSRYLAPIVLTNTTTITMSYTLWNNAGTGGSAKASYELTEYNS